MLQNIKWTGNSYPLESHISNHRQAFDDIRECALHITTNVPSEPQRVEYLIDSITSKDNTLQAAIGLIRANTNNMRNEFEPTASSLIEVDPYQKPNSQCRRLCSCRKGIHGCRSSISFQRQIFFFTTRPTTGTKGVAKDKRWAEIEKGIVHEEFK